MSTLQDRISELMLATGLSVGQLAEIAGVSSSAVSQWKDGPTKALKTGPATRLAERTGYHARWIADGDGPKKDDRFVSNTTPGPAIRGQVPLISWVRAGELCEAPDNYHPGDAEHWMDCPVPHGPRTYCLQLSGDSMDDGGADAYRDGEIIFVDPDASADPGRDVVVRTPDNKTTFKRLKEDQEGQYLLGLNGKKIVRVPDGTVFCGVVIFSGRRR